LRFTEEEGDVLVGDAYEAVQNAQGVFEFFCKLAMFLITPGFAKRRESAVEGGHSAFEIEVESFEFLSEDAYFFGVDDCFGHGENLREVKNAVFRVVTGYSIVFLTGGLIWLVFWWWFDFGIKWINVAMMCA